MKNKLLTLFCDKFTFQSAFSELDEELFVSIFKSLLGCISNDVYKVTKQDLKQLAENITIQDDPVKTA